MGSIPKTAFSMTRSGCLANWSRNDWITAACSKAGCSTWLHVCGLGQDKEPLSPLGKGSNPGFRPLSHKFLGTSSCECAPNKSELQMHKKDIYKLTITRANQYTCKVATACIYYKTGILQIGLP